MSNTSKLGVKAQQDTAKKANPLPFGGFPNPYMSGEMKQFGGAFGEYMIDAMQRTVLFWDVLRQRGDDYYSQKEMPVPHVLKFDADVIIEAFDAVVFDQDPRRPEASLNPSPPGLWFTTR